MKSLNVRPKTVLCRYNDVCLRDLKIRSHPGSYRTIHTQQESVIKPLSTSDLSFWKTKSNQRQYLDWLEEQIGIRDYAEWYSIPPSVILKHGGRPLLDEYGKSLYAVLSSVYPERKFLPWKFLNVPSSHWDSIENQRAFFDWIGSQLDYQNKDDFYKLTAKQAHEYGGSFIYPRYNNSIYNTLKNIYPEHKWLPWKFLQTPKSMWQDPNNRKAFLEWLATQLNITDMNAWYEVSTATIRKYGGDSLLQMYNNNTFHMLSSVYPGYKWLPWKFSQVPEGFWNSLENQRQYFDWLTEELGLKEDEWHKINTSDFRNNGAITLIQRYGTVSALLSKVYPEKDVASWKFSKVSDDYWSNSDNITAYFDAQGKSLGVQELNDWYSIPTLQIHRGLMKKFNNSLLKALSAAYPNHKWLPWKFQRVPKAFWSSTENQKAFIEWFEKEMKIDTPDKWYQITSEDIIRHGGLSLLREYQFSLVGLLQSIYPNVTWESWKFSYATKSEWAQNPSAISKLVQDLSDKLYIQTLDDWYRVSMKQIYEAGGGRLMLHYGNLPKMLKALYPQHNWNSTQFRSTSKKASQRWLKIVLEKIFPEKGSLDKIELDLFVPSLNLALEYQGEQHYEDKFFFGSQMAYRQRDFKKRAACEAAGITLVEIPYWWNRSEDSLRATIAQVRPDLLSSAGAPIPSEPPFQRARGVQLSDPIDWQSDPHMDPKGWLLCPKYEGVRCYWNGKKLLTKNGKQIRVPAELLVQLPAEVSLDGELWVEDGSFEDLMSVMKSKEHPNLWKKVKLFVTDIPSLDLPVEQRIERLMKLPTTEFIQQVPVIQCTGRDHLESYLEGAVAQGASGVLLRAPNSKYEAGRTSSCRKFIKYERSFAKFVKSFPQNNGILCEQLNGLLCVARCGASLFKNPPSPGTVVEIEHAGQWKSGRLKHPTYIETKPELKWENVTQ